VQQWWRIANSNNVAETSRGQSDQPARSLTAAGLFWNWPPEAPINCRHIDSNLDDYHSDPMEISGTLWLRGITDWWRQPEKMHSKYTDLSNVACNIFSIIRHWVGVEANFSLGGYVISWRQSKTTWETLRKNINVRQFAWVNNRILAGDEPALDKTDKENDSEMKK